MASIYDSNVIDKHPIGQHLDSFRSLLSSRCKEAGIQDNVTASDRMARLAETSAIKNLAISLIMALQAIPLATALPSCSGTGFLQDDLLRLGAYVGSTRFNGKAFVEVFEVVERHATDQEVCVSLLSLLRAQVATPPTVHNEAFIDTPYKSNSASQTGDEQTHADLDLRILQEINGCVYKNTSGFYEKYFEGKPWSKKAQKIVDKVNPQIIRGRWTGYPVLPSQDAFLEWLFDFQNKYIKNHRSRYYSSPDLPLAGSECKRKPDIFLARFDASNRETRYNWAEVHVIGELKQSMIRGKQTTELLHFCGNAREVFASQPCRRFLHGFIVRGSLVELWTFDRSGLYSSEQFDLHQNPHRFLKIIIGYTLMSDEELGLNTYIKKDRTGSYIEIKQECGQGQERLYLEETPIDSQRAIVSRGTACYRAKRKKVEHWEYVVKFAWRSSLRRVEGDILQLAKERNVWGIADLRYHRDLETIASLREGLQFGKPKAFRSADKDSISQSRQPGPSNSLGIILMTVESVSGQKRKSRDEMPPPASTKRLRLASVNQADQALPKAHADGLAKVEPMTSSADAESQDNRIFSCLVTAPPGRPISRFKSVKELLEAFHDFIKAHESLYIKGRILHRDISENNVIITDPEKMGDARGRLIDLDMARNLDDGPSGAKHRTGTMQFMAIEVLRGKAHTYRHDLESLFYVFLWVIIKNGREHVPYGSYLRMWYRGSYAEMALKKFGQMDEAAFSGILDEFPAEMEGLKSLGRILRDILFPYRRGLFTGTYEDPHKLYQPMMDAFKQEIAKSGS